MEATESVEGTTIAAANSATTPELVHQQQQQQQQNRAVGSLVLLTQNFVKLMKDNNGYLDLKTVSPSIHQ